MTLEEYNELFKLYYTSSGLIAEIVDNDVTDDGADMDGVEEVNYFGKICSFARTVMSDLERIGLDIPNHADVLDDYILLKAIAILNRTVNSDKLLAFLRSVSDDELKKFINDCSFDDSDSLDDVYDRWFETFINRLLDNYPLNSDLQTVKSLYDVVYCTSVFRDRMLKILNHLRDERSEEHLEEDDE